MTIYILFMTASVETAYTKVVDAYTKDGLFCLSFENGEIIKFPLSNIFSIRSNYRKEG